MWQLQECLSKSVLLNAPNLLEIIWNVLVLVLVVTDSDNKNRTFVQVSSLFCNDSSTLQQETQNGHSSPWCLPKSVPTCSKILPLNRLFAFAFVTGVCRNYERKKPPFLFLNEKKLHRMNIHYAFSIREVSEVVDSDQTLQVVAPPSPSPSPLYISRSQSEGWAQLNSWLNYHYDPPYCLHCPH